MTCERWAVVVVPFPFSERPGQKRRPALVLSDRLFNEAGHTVLAMITTTAHRRWPGDTRIETVEAAGLPLSCVVRLKLFTLDNRLLLRAIGVLASPDRKQVAGALRQYVFTPGPTEQRS